MASLNSNALTTVSDVKETLGLAASDTSKDNLIIRKINQASDMIESYLGRSLGTGTYTEEYDASGTDTLVLNNWPVTTFTTLGYADSPFSDAGYTTEDTENYWVDLENGAVRSVNDFFGGTRGWSVTYTAGYDLPAGPDTSADPLPSDIREAAAELAAFLVNSSTTPKGIKRESLGDRSVEYFGGYGGERRPHYSTWY